MKTTLIRAMALILLGLLGTSMANAAGRNETVYTRTYPAGSLHVSLVAPEIVRVQFVPAGANAKFPRIPLVLPQTPASERFRVMDRPDGTALIGSRLHVKIHGTRPRVDFYDSQGKPLSLDAGGLSESGGQVRDARALGGDEQLFGGGLQFHSFAQRGTTKALKVNADPKTDLGNSHAVVPFFLSTAGYGIYLDSHAYTHFDLGQTETDRLTFGTPDPVLDYYFCAGPTFHDLLRHYTQLTGRMRMPPKWGLGFWYRMKSDWKQDHVTQVAQAFRDHHLPCDVLGLEPHWMTHSYSASYIWDKEYYPDPAGFVAGMRRQGFHLNLWEHAYVHPTSPLHDPLARARAAGDKLVWGGLVPDFTRPAARALFAGLHRKEHLALGVDGYKLDECDGSDFTGGWFFPDDTRFPSGLSGAQMHNVFGFLYQKTFHEMFAAQNQRTYLLCRAGFTGSQAYPTVIYSDYYGLEQYVRAAANSGFSGILWCPEVRQTSDPDEFVRRLQLTFFSPLAMINAWQDGVTPWEKGPEIEGVFRRYDDLRTQLLPYLYSAFWKMHETGLPVVRALVMDWPKDRNTYAVDSEFLYGDSLLVAPVLTGNERAVYLPAGEWTDWWTGERHAGGRTLAYAAPTDRLPLFVKAGAIIPMQPPMLSEDGAAAATLTLRVYPGHAGGEGHLTLYDDAGVTLDYQKGHHVTVALTCRSSGSAVTLKAEAPKGRYVPAWKTLVWELHGLSHCPAEVRAGRRKLSPAAQLEANEVGRFHYQEATHTLSIPRRFGDAAPIRLLR